MTTYYYAGVGSRNTPHDVLELMYQIAYELPDNWILRSGAADGADTAFEKGAIDSSKRMEVFLPWNGYNGRNHDGIKYIAGNPHSYTASAIAKMFHPNWDNLSQGVKKLMARNSHQLLGEDLMVNSSMLVCWTPEGKGGGGTGQAIRIARFMNIPVFDLAIPEYIDNLVSHVNKLQG